MAQRDPSAGAAVLYKGELIMRLIAHRFMLVLSLVAAELWLGFYLASRPWVEPWAENALIWQMILSTAVLVIWCCRGQEG